MGPLRQSRNLSSVANKVAWRIHDFQYGTFRAMVAPLAHPIQIFSVTVALFFGVYLLIAKDLWALFSQNRPVLIWQTFGLMRSTQAQRIKYLWMQSKR